MKAKNINLKLKKACDTIGGQNVLAHRLGVSCPTVNQWIKGVRPVPLKRMPDIETATNGVASRKDLCSEWARYWPELVEK